MCEFERLGEGGTRRKRSRDTCLLVFTFGIKHRTKYC